MKILIFLIVSILTTSTFAKSLKWSDLVVEKTYKIQKEINISSEKQSFTVKKGEAVTLFESMPLPMIKVQLLKFSLSSCPSDSMETQLDLLNIEQASGAPVVIGFDLDQNCTLEIFIENKDIYSASIFK